MPKKISRPAATPYAGLTPACLLDAVESTGLRCDGRLAALNSFENRVYQVWLDSGESIVAKFYRPKRWSGAACCFATAPCANAGLWTTPMGPCQCC